jgi:ankyrin repeat protein
MSFIWTESILDNQLFWEFSKSNPDEKAIRSLIEQGADINSIDCKGDSVLMDAISNVQDGLDLKFIQLIIDLGADLDYAEEGFNCLFDASLTQRPELVELLFIILPGIWTTS